MNPFDRGAEEPGGSPTPDPNVSDGGASGRAQHDWYTAASSDDRTDSDAGQGRATYGAGYGHPSSPYGSPYGQYGQQAPYGRAGGYGASQPSTPYGYGQGDPWAAYGGASVPATRRGHGLRTALIAVAIVAGLVVLAAGFGGGIGAAYLLRGGTIGGPVGSTTPSTGGSGSSPSSGSGGSGSNTIDLNSLASKLDPAIVDIDGVQKDASGQTVTEDAGTGVILTSDGEVLTNNHVIEGNDSMTATLSTGKTVDVKVLGEDPTADVALVQLEGVSGLPTINIQNGAKASVGEAVADFGNALGKGGTPADSQGTVTGMGETITASLDDGSGQTETLNNMVEMSAQICEGDSGGVLANAQGQYLGMLTAGSAGSGSGQNPGSGNGGDEPGSGSGGSGSGSSSSECSNDGYVIPAADAEAVVKQIQSGQRTSQVIIGVPGFLGVEIDSTASVEGAQVQGLVDGGAAAEAGLPSSFVITAINGQPITDSTDLSTALEQYTPGTTVQVTWNDGAGGASQTTNVTLGSGPPA